MPKISQILALVPSVKKIKAENITSLTLDEFIIAVKSKQFKLQISQLKSYKIKDPDKYRELKQGLPAVAFGVYKGDLINPNYIFNSLVLFNGDVDDLINEDLLQELRELLMKHPAVVYCFVSPSGLGLKFGINVGAIRDDAHYKQLFDFMTAWVKKEIHPELILDRACKDIRRLCFVSHDPQAYLNLEAELLPTPEFFNLEPVKSAAKSDIQQLSLQAPLIFDNFYSVQDDCLGVVTHLLLMAKAGDRHLTRLKVAKLAWGFVAGGLVDKDIIWNRLIGASDRIADNGITNPTELKALNDGFENGLSMPISHKMFLQEHSGDTKGISLFESNDLCMDASSVEVNFETTKSGRIKATLNNIHTALNNRQFSEINVAYDLFKDQIMYYVGNSSEWLPLTDDAYTKFRIELPKLGFEEIPAPLMKDVVNFTAKQNKFDSAQQLHIRTHHEHLFLSIVNTDSYRT